MNTTYLIPGTNDKDAIRFSYIKSRSNGSDINLLLVCFFWSLSSEYREIQYVVQNNSKIHYLAKLFILI